MSDNCVTCGQRVRERQHGVKCDSCGLWNHRTCNTGISIEAYRHAVKTQSDLPFVCQPCVDRIPATDEAVDETVDQNSTNADSTVHGNFNLSIQSDVTTASAEDNSEQTDPGSIDGDNSVRIDLTFEEPRVIHETSLTDPQPTNAPVPCEPVDFEVVRGGSQKGHDLLCDTLGYSYTVKSVLRLLGTNSVEGFVIDYERAMWRAINRVFPDTITNGCVFHWGQAVWKKVQNLGLATQYGTDRGTHAFIRKLLSLPFLPAEHIRPTFQTLCDLNTCDAIEPLLEYIDIYWIKSTVWPVENWSVFGQSVCTNNDCEGWHRRLNHRVGVSPPFHVLIRQLHLESIEIAEQVVMVSELSLRRLQRKNYRLAQAKLFEAWDSYRDGTLTTTGLLKTVSTIYEYKVPTPTEDEDDE